MVGFRKYVDVHFSGTQMKSAVINYVNKLGINPTLQRYIVPLTMINYMLKLYAANRQQEAETTAYQDLLHWTLNLPINKYEEFYQKIFQCPQEVNNVNCVDMHLRG